MTGLFHPFPVWQRTIRGTACLGWIAAIVLLFLVTVGVAREARAGCNLIPVAAEELPSTGVVGDVAAVNDGAVVNGFVTRPIAGPGQTVTLGVDVDCDPQHFLSLLITARNSRCRIGKLQCQ